jgi:hypothetical protein
MGTILKDVSANDINSAGARAVTGDAQIRSQNLAATTVAIPGG